MIQSKIINFGSEIVLLIALLGFFTLKKPYYEWDRVINSDGKGYYAYLPAIFIYNDLDYKFVESYEAKYYPGDQLVFKEFRYNWKGEIVNKTFIGLAILWLPFFLIAHIFSLLSGFEADGYSLPYQYAIGLATIIYCWLGLKALVTLLVKSGASTRLANCIIICMGLGTNLLYYTFYVGSMVHVYNFFLITMFLYCLRLSFINLDRKWIIITSLFLGLVIITRPQNGFIILLFPYIAGTKENMILFLRKLFGNIRIFIWPFLSICFILLIPMLLWYLQTGYILAYSYGQESFDFMNPHFFSLLFSYNNGWFIYTPLAFFAMLGLIQLFNKNKLQFFSILGLLIIIVYVFSSWWVWNYYSRFGQRVFVDYYAVTALLLFHTHELFKKRKTLLRIFYSLIVLIMMLNTIQFYQHYKFIFPGGDINKKIYWDSLFRIKPLARYQVPKQIIISHKSYFNDMEHDNGWNNHVSLSTEKAHSGIQSSAVNNEMQFSFGFNLPIARQFNSPFKKILASAFVYTDVRRSGSQIVITCNSNGEPFAYKAYALKEFTRKNKWTYVEFGLNVPEIKTVSDSLIIYFWNPNKVEHLYVDDFKVDFLSLKESL